MSAANLPGGPQPCNSGLECWTPHWEIWTSSCTHRLKRLHMHFKTCLVLHLCTLQCWPCKMLSTAKLFHIGLVYFCYKPITFIELAVEWLISCSWKSIQNDTNKTVLTEQYLRECWHDVYKPPHTGAPLLKKRAIIHCQWKPLLSPAFFRNYQLSKNYYYTLLPNNTQTDVTKF